MDRRAAQASSPDMILFILSYVANVTITFAVGFGIWRNHGSMTEAYGPDGPARRILACVYLAIGLISLYALAQIGLGSTDVARTIGMTLLPLQIVYKLKTAYALWMLHPVVMANLGISALLGFTLLVAG